MTMLNKAIVDAKQLKEAAQINAEKIVLDKYASQIKEELDRLLEQDDELDLDAPLEDDPLADPLGDAPEANSEIDGMKDQIPLAATEGEKTCPCPDDKEKIEIDFDELVSKVDSEPTEMPGELPGNELALEETVDVPSDLGPDLHNYHSSVKDPIYQVGSLALAGQPVQKSMLETARTQLEELAGSVEPEDMAEVQGLVSRLSELLGPVVAEEPQQLDNLPDELYEAVSSMLEETVDEVIQMDYENVPTGNVRNAPLSDQDRAVDVEAAKLQDEKYKEELKQRKDALDQLQKEHKELATNYNYLKQRVSSLQEQKTGLKDIATTAAEELKKLSLQNAKLLYENKILRDFSLNERQKDKVVEALSKVKTVDQAKATHDLLIENVNKRDSGNKGLDRILQERAQTITMPSTRIAKEQEKETLNESAQKNRMLKIAGIKRRN